MTRRSKTRLRNTRTGEITKLKPVEKNQRVTGLDARLGAAVRSRAGLRLTAEEVRTLKARKESSPEMSSLASAVLQYKDHRRNLSKVTKDDIIVEYRAFVQRVQSLAGSVLSQDETKGQK